jgi:arginase
MNIEIIQVPYDSGHFCERTGRGPDYFVENGIAKLLQNDGHHVIVHRIESKSTFPTEITTAFELNQTLAEHIRSLSKNRFPLVLSGNCNSCAGTLSGISLDQIGIIWFDAHGDFNTPDTSITGFLDGMGLAMATGRCWGSLLRQIPGYKAVPDSNVIHVGALDLDPEEKRMFEKAGIPLITNTSNDEGNFIGLFKNALKHLQRHVKSIYLHIDMDVLDMAPAKANHLALPGGLRVETVMDCLEIVKENFDIRACGIASVDPAFDKNKIVLKAGLGLIRTLFEK